MLGASFWINYTYVYLSIPIPIGIDNPIQFSIIVFLFCFGGSYFTLAMSRAHELKIWKYIVSSFFITFLILSVTTFGLSILFMEFVDFKSALFFLSFLTVSTTAFCLLRFLRQITNEEDKSIRSRWLNFGSIVCGLSIGGIPYLVLTTILDFDSLLQHEYSGYAFLDPFIYVMSTNFILMISPDLFAERVLSTTLVKYKSLFSFNPNAVYSVDLDGKITSVNKEMVKMTGYDQEELIGEDFISLLLRIKDKQSINDYLSQVRKGSVKDIETTITDKSNQITYVKITTMTIVINGSITGYYAVMKDISEERRSQEVIQKLVYYDDLTKLYNRRKLLEIINDLVTKKQEFSIMLIDFDRFKRINDSFGHAFGDELLKKIAVRLKSVMKDNGIVGRLGGDEFLIVCQKTDIESHYLPAIINEFRKPMTIMGVEVISTASVGVSSYPIDSNNIDELLKFADIAMYHTKDNGSNGYSLFSNSMLNGNLEGIAIENELRHAIEENELSIYYQPKYNMINGEMVGAESLSRWRHPIKGFIPPSIFIPLAEEIGIIDKLEKNMIVGVCEMLSRWKSENRKIYRTSINISLPTLLNDDLIEFISATLTNCHIDGSLLEFEITERIVMKYEEEVNYKLQQLREFGIEISIDDFGTGYSSLSYLYKLEVDRLKIDKSFVDQCVVNSEVVSTIISLAKGLGLKVIAEGVEDKEQLEVLLDLGCYEAQGFYYCKPLDYAEFELRLPTITTYSQQGSNEF